MQVGAFQASEDLDHAQDLQECAIPKKSQNRFCSRLRLRPDSTDLMSFKIEIASNRASDLNAGY